MISGMFDYMDTLTMERPGGAVTSVFSGNAEIGCTGYQNLVLVSNSQESLLRSPEQSEFFKWKLNTEYLLFSCRVSE